MKIAGGFINIPARGNLFESNLRNYRHLLSFRFVINVSTLELCKKHKINPLDRAYSS